MSTARVYVRLFSVRQIASLHLDTIDQYHTIRVVSAFSAIEILTLGTLARACG